MFTSNDLRILIKGFTVTLLIIGIFFPIVSVEVQVESTDNMLEDFDEDYLIINSNTISQASIDEINDQIVFTQVKENTVISFILLILVIVSIGVLTISIFANSLEIESKFFGGGYSTTVGYVSFLLIFAIIFFKKFLFESDLTSVDGRLTFDNIVTSRGEVSVYMSVKESIIYTMMQISLISYIILPLTNKWLVERK